MTPTRRTTSLGLAAVLFLGRPSMGDAKAAELFTLVGRIGMGLDELKTGSTYPLQLARVTDMDLTAATEPSVFTYAGPGGFTLPPTHLVTFSSTAAVIEGIEVSPHLVPLGLDDAIALYHDIERLLLSAGWMREDQNMVGLEELRVRVRDPGSSDQARWPVARLVLGSVEAMLAIKRTERASRLAGLLGGEDAFILRLELADGALSARLDRIAATLNRQDGTTLPRVIELGPYLARVRTMLARGRHGLNPPWPG